jgi:AraC-like DNA-binding protein
MDAPLSPIVAAADFQIARAAWRAGAHVATHDHDEPHLVMVFNGQWEDSGLAGRWTLGEGEVLFHPARTSHANAWLPNTDIVLLSLSSRLIARFCALYGNCARPVHVGFDELGGVPDMLRAELQSPDSATTAVAEGLIVQMLALGSRASRNRSAPVWLPRALQFVRANLSSSLSVQTVSAAAGISPSRLAHAFRAATGRTLREYVREARVGAAAHALRTTSRSVADIALSLGFYDQSHLCRAFKTLKRLTPLEYRRIRRTGNVNE